ncbi:Hypothetical protein, putative, partial [Bodo saltans]
ERNYRGQEMWDPSRPRDPSPFSVATRVYGQQQSGSDYDDHDYSYHHQQQHRRCMNTLGAFECAREVISCAVAFQRDVDEQETARSEANKKPRLIRLDEVNDDYDPAVAPPQHHHDSHAAAAAAKPQHRTTVVVASSDETVCRFGAHFGVCVVPLKALLDGDVGSGVRVLERDTVARREKRQREEKEALMNDEFIEDIIGGGRSAAAAATAIPSSLALAVSAGSLEESRSTATVTIDDPIGGSATLLGEKSTKSSTVDGDRHDSSPLDKNVAADNDGQQRRAPPLNDATLIASPTAAPLLPSLPQVGCDDGEEVVEVEQESDGDDNDEDAAVISAVGDNDRENEEASSASSCVSHEDEDMINVDDIFDFHS